MIEFKNVSMIYENGTRALNNVNLTFPDGDFAFVIGRSGAGKTTLTKLILCEERITSGELYVNKFALHKIPDRKISRLRRTMGVVFQDFRLFPNMTVFENIAFAMRVIGETSSSIRKHVPYLIDLVGLTEKENCFPSQISGGEQQRVAFARALANNPDIVIADEPTGNVDYEMSKDLMDLLIRVNRFKKTVIVVTHDDQLVNNYQKRVVTIRDGEVISDVEGGRYEI